MAESRPVQSRNKKQALGNIVVEKAFDLGEEEEVIHRQLGFRPTNVHSIAARAMTGEPTVLRLYPLAVSLKGARARNAERQPFPTMYWLSCPSLKAAVSQLENQGLILEWERRLQADPVIMADMEAAHKSYAEERWSLLSAEDVDTIKRQGWEKSFSNGVAGIVQPRHIKCLHTHFAHFLATGRNVVGKWTQEALDAGKHLPVAEDG
ncbi:unnamed protein product [Ectocarpus sp. 6 AP-2014]